MRGIHPDGAGVGDQVRLMGGGGSFSRGWRTDLVSVILPFDRRDHVSS